MMALMIISANLHDGPNDHFCFLIGVSLENWIILLAFHDKAACNAAKNTVKVLLEEYDKKLQISSYIKRAQNRVTPETMANVNMFKYSICHIPLVRFWKSLCLWCRKGFWEVLRTIN
jgi:hypothetical protein